MNRLQLLLVVLTGLLLVTAGLVWLCGPFGLIGAGLAAVAAGLFVDVKE